MTPAELGQLVTGTSGFLLLVMAGYAVANLRFRVPGTKAFLGLTLAGAAWAFGYGFEKAQFTLEGFILASQLEYLGLPFVPVLWLLVALAWMEHPLYASRAFRVGCVVAALSFTALVITNPIHHLFYRNIVLTGRMGFARYLPGPLYYGVFGAFLSTFVISSLLALTRNQWVPKFRQRALVILGANVTPLLFAVLFQLGFRPGGLDLTIFSLVPAFGVVAWGLFRHDFIRIVPIARETVVESLEQAVLVHDAEGRLVDHNAAAASNLAWLEEALSTRQETMGELKHPEGRTFRFRRSTIRTGSGAVQGTATIVTDVTAEKLLLVELEHQATHDALTGIANRRHFETHALAEITRAGRHAGELSLVLLDIDRFKQVNDLQGHPAGDQVLKDVVQAVGSRLRPYDLLARLGGEEFGVLMPQASAAAAREAAERWRAALEAETTVTASFGVATLEPQDSATTARSALNALLAAADHAMYAAKEGGRNRVC